MLDTPVRVALLARPGEARDQLRRALAELGAELVAEGDPAELDPGHVAGQNPSVVLVSLEPALEGSLERFDDLLAAPGIQVMYDDAEVTGQLDGWDLARWARHLASKLVGSDLLPPPPGGADHLPEFELSLEPGAPPTPAEEMAGEKLEDYASESIDLSEWVPSEPSLAAEPVAEPISEPDLAQDYEYALDLDLGDLEQALGRTDAVLEAGRDAEADEMQELSFDAGDLDIDLSALPEEGVPLPTLQETHELAPSDEPLLVDLELASEPVNFSSFSDEETPMSEQMDDDVAALAAQLDAYEAQDRPGMDEQAGFGEGPPPLPDDLALSSEHPPAPSDAAGSVFGSLELMPMEQEVVTVADAEQPAPVSPLGMSSRETGRMSLAAAESTENNETTSGGLLVLAGLGGPDAVRQLLSALPPTLRVPVLLYQHLDTGKHDRLVGQLAKASQLPLDLAVEGKLAFPGRVAVLQPGMGVNFSEANFEFARAEDLSQVVSALPATESAVMLLSGADPAVMPAVLALQAAGATVLAQDPSTCFDATSAEQAIQAGAASATPTGLAQLVIERWS
jgi:chemotaxis response regulator CheB